MAAMTAARMVARLAAVARALVKPPHTRSPPGRSKRFSIVGVAEGCEVKLGADCEGVEEAGRPGRRGALGSEA